MNETVFEMIKSYAYGCSDEEIAELYDITAGEAEKYRNVYSAEVRERQEELKKAGYIE